MAIWFIFTAMCLGVLIGILLCYVLNRFSLHINNLWKKLDNLLKNRVGLFPSIHLFASNFPQLTTDLNELETLKSYTISSPNLAVRHDQEVEITKHLKNVFSILTKEESLQNDLQFSKLKKSISLSEQGIKDLKNKYNKEVRRFNAIISIIPLNIIAAVCEINEKECFSATSEHC